MKRIVLATLVVLGMAGSSVIAHHPFDAEYDWKRPVTITGTVTKFEWKNPHSTIELKGKDQTGTEAQWSIELGSTAQLQQASWTSGQIKAGDQITVEGWLAKDGRKMVSGRSVKMGNGQQMFAAGAFYDPESRPTAASSSGRTAAPTTGTTQPKPAR